MKEAVAKEAEAAANKNKVGNYSALRLRAAVLKAKNASTWTKNWLPN